MRRIPIVELALGFTIFAATAATVLAHGYTVGDIEIGHPWSRATPDGAKVAGGYLTIRNTGAAPDRLVSGSFERAGRFEIHEMKVENGVMTMRPLGEGIEIAPGAELKLAPGGYHLMFMDLSARLSEGEKVKGTLTFEKAGSIEVEFAVEGMGARDGGHGASHGGGNHAH